jgi:Rps23 Pro-64 3,4-dihydroxylase Tpa1-like proline 4-hydroxylase
MLRMADPELNPALDAAAVALTFARDGRVHVPDILTADSAARVHHCLAQDTDFAIVTRNADGYVRLRPGAALTAQQQSDLMRDAFEKARDNFHYVYDNHPMSQDGEAYPDPAHALAAVTRFLNSAPLLDFARRVTGSNAIAFAEAQATRFRPGHFLNLHDDSHPRHGRIAAYVLNMTPRWRIDWGGALLFTDRAGHVSEGYLPTFNALNILAVPQSHLVGIVAPFAGAPRLSITGWFRSH